MTDSSATTSYKNAAVDFLELVSAGRIDEAYDKYVDMKGRHHNPSVRAGLPALKEAMAENQAQFPLKWFIVMDVVGEGDRVAVFSHTVLAPLEGEFAVMHLFRFRDGKIVELWDWAQPVPAESINRDGMF